MKTRSFSIVLTILGLLAILMSAGGAAAQNQSASTSGNQPDPPIFPTTKLTYQGRLTSNSGSPVSTAVTMTFRIYDDKDTLMWTSAGRSVTPANGLFTVVLGESPDPALLSAILSNAASIGVTVGSDVEMTPRQPLNTLVGYSAVSTGVIGGSDTGTGIYAKSNSGIGLYAYSSSGAAVYGYSPNGAGVQAVSNAGSNTNAAIVASNTLTTTGMAGYFSNNSGYPALQVGNAGLGKAGEFFSSGTNPTASFTNNGVGSTLNLYNNGGPFINSFDQTQDNVFQVKGNGDVAQSLYANGLVKAAARLQCGNTDTKIFDFFNLVSGAVTASNGDSAGKCYIDFGFDLTTRYVTVMVNNAVPANSNCITGLPNVHTLTCYVYDYLLGNPPFINGGITVLVY